jgi:predicted RNase H-like HicB family nuclease
MGGVVLEFVVKVHTEDGSYWAQVVELPGVFASGDTLDELVEALGEAISLYRNEAGGEVVDLTPVDEAAEELLEGAKKASTQELRIAVPA